MNWLQQFILGQALAVIQALVASRTINLNDNAETTLRGIRDGINVLIGQ